MIQVVLIVRYFYCRIAKEKATMGVTSKIISKNNIKKVTTCTTTRRL